ncbi:MinD/ParA family protein [Mycobacterium sp. SM1]|uniref:MinD/ParA family ATP-binding protein n=1 Tax=Mycobacterium sp. SM1 TaxID=2816243 RepID=UPI001BCBB5A9|nr:MinD/ParA family protein [Mycobacterium sp. SM1]MBS4728067.1 MinD/ParA family protein [Mycobacterium sp. SM1]
MSGRDDFLRDRLPSGRPGLPSTLPSGGDSRNPPAAPPPAFLAPGPHAASRVSPRPPAAFAAPRSTVRPPRTSSADIAVEPQVTSLTPCPSRRGRRLLRLVTLGLVNRGPSARERREADHQAAVQTILRGTYKVGVLGKGGVGKTSIAASVGSIFAELRRQDRVVAIDADPAFGRLADRVDPRASSSYWDLAADKNLQSFADVRARVGNNAAGLYVLAGGAAAAPRRILDPAIYREAARRLDRHFTISIIDCGSSMDAPVTQEVLRDLDALIVVSSPWADGASTAAKTLEWLAEHGRIDLLQRTVVVLNDSDGHADKHTRSLLARQFLDRGQPVVEVPFDPHLRPGGVIDVSREMAPATRRKFLEIAATVTRYFASRSPTMRAAEERGQQVRPDGARPG